MKPPACLSGDLGLGPGDLGTNMGREGGACGFSSALLSKRSFELRKGRDRVRLGFHTPGSFAILAG
jgi:hypothetical protein